MHTTKRDPANHWSQLAIAHTQKAKAQPVEAIAYRVRFELDRDARFEECNGEARPLTEAEYRENQYRACPLHPRGYQGDKGQDTAEQGQGYCACGRAYEDVPYADYLAYYGNPDQHRYIGVLVDLVCSCCDHVTERAKAGLWNIDLMIDNPEWLYIRRKLGRTFTTDEAIALPGYLAEVARETLHEAGWTAEGS